MASRNCGHCMATSARLKDGWKLSNGSFAQLCEICSFEFENNTFCAKFHGDSQGFRECSICGKMIHCGCIVSLHMYKLLDMGGIGCVGCIKEPCAPVPNQDIVSDPGSSVPLNLRNSQPQYYSWAPTNELRPGAINPNQPKTILELFPCSQPNHEPNKAKTSDLVSSPNFSRQTLRIGAPTKGAPAVAANDQPVLRGKRYKKPTKASRSYKQNLSQGKRENNANKPKTRALMINATTVVSDFSGTNMSQNEASPRISIPSEPNNARGKRPIDPFAASGDENALTVVPYGTNLIDGPDNIPNMVSLEISFQSAPPHRQNPPMSVAFGGPSSQGHSSSSSNEVIIRHLFEKKLSMTDATHSLTRLILPKIKAQAVFPDIPDSHSQTVRFDDEMGREWHFRVRCWLYRKSRLYILEGVKQYRTLMKWQTGDIVAFGKIEPDGNYVIRTIKASEALSGN